MESAAKEGAAGRGKFAKLLWNAAGTFFLAIGLIGIAVPLLPTTPLLLLAAACYLRGSRRMHDWMMSNKHIGTYLSNYAQGKGMTRRAKAITLLALWGLISASAILFTEDVAVRLILLAVAAAVTVHILTMKTAR